MNRTTTPGLSPNPFQKFVTLKQARRSAKGAAIVAGVIAGGSILTLPMLLRGVAAGVWQTQATGQALVAYSVLTAVIFALLAWRIWRRPGPIKTGVVLAYAALNFLSVCTVMFSIPNVIMGFLFVVFSLAAFRGALAMPALAGQADLAKTF